MKYRSDKRWNKGHLRNQTYCRDVCWNRASHYTCRTWFPIRRKAGWLVSVVRPVPNQRPLFDTTSRKPNLGSFAKTMGHFIFVYVMTEWGLFKQNSTVVKVFTWKPARPYKLKDKSRNSNLFLKYLFILCPISKIQFCFEHLILFFGCLFAHCFKFWSVPGNVHHILYIWRQSAELSARYTNRPATSFLYLTH